MQKTKTKERDEDITYLLRQRKSRNKLLSNDLSKVYINDVYMYDVKNYSKNRQEKSIVIEISTKDNLYSKKFIINTARDNYMTPQKCEKIFKKLYNLKSKPVYVEKLPIKGHMLRLKKPKYTSKVYKLVSNFMMDIAHNFIMTFMLVGFILTIIFLPQATTAFVYLILFLFIPIVIFIPEFISHYINKNRLGLCEFEDNSNIYDITEKTIKDMHLNQNKHSLNFEPEKVIVTKNKNNEVIIRNNNAKWIFEKDDGVISEKFINFYNDYGGEFDFGGEIDVLISKCKNNTSLDENMYLSECENWILKSLY